MNESSLLILNGFGKKDKLEEISYNTLKKEEDKKDKLKTLEENGTIHQYADHDIAEAGKDQLAYLPYPKPLSRYTVVYETVHQSIEPVYYWCINHLQDMGFVRIEKITDIFAAGEHSSFYGAGAQRLGLAQDKVSQFLIAIGQFIRKDLFQLVRDIKWIDERLAFHEDARKGLESAEITLKGIWTDLVDGVMQGQRVSANIFTMSQQLQFTSLPDFFFGVHPTKTEDVDKMVDALPVNKVVKSVLKRKLHQYVVWREENYKELKQRKQFELRYLQQQVNVLKLYMSWLKPYLRHIERLGSDITKLSSPELVAAFESSMVEIELLAEMKPEKGNKYACLLLSFDYRTKPSMSFTQDAYHRGPMHVGQTTITWRSYAWDEKQIEAFKKFKEKEDLNLLSSIDSSIKIALEALGEDFDKYLKEAENIKEETAPEKPKQEGLFEPLLTVPKAVLEGVSDMIPKKKPLPKEEDDSAKKLAPKLSWGHYKIFKKKHGMLTW